MKTRLFLVAAACLLTAACSNGGGSGDIGSDLEGISKKIQHHGDQCPAVTGSYCSAPISTNDGGTSQDCLNLQLQKDSKGQLMFTQDNGTPFEIDGKIHTIRAENHTIKYLGYCTNDTMALYVRADVGHGDVSISINPDNSELRYNSRGEFNGHSINDSQIYKLPTMPLSPKR